MICKNCGFDTEKENGRCPHCGGFLDKTEEEAYFAQLDYEAERQSEFDRRIGYKEFEKPFPL